MFAPPRIGRAVGFGLSVCVVVGEPEPAVALGAAGAAEAALEEAALEGAAGSVRMVLGRGVKDLIDLVVGTEGELVAGAAQRLGVGCREIAVLESVWVVMLSSA